MKLGAWSCCLLLIGALAAYGQSWPDKNSATPRLVQTGFGPNGAALPFDGADYCGPTTAAMALGYLNAAGFTQLIGPSPGDAEYLNLVRVLSGLGESSDSGGSFAGSLLAGMGTYMDAKGIGASQRTIPNGSGGYRATIADIQSANVDQQILFGVLGWYFNEGGVYTRNGGHFFAITDQTPGAPGSLTIHNPFPNALLDQPNMPAFVQQTIPMATFTANSTNNNYPLPVGTYLQFAPGQQNIGPTSGVQAILEQVFTVSINASQLPSGGFTPQDWEIATEQTLNTGGGNLDVTTRVTGAGGIRKISDGNLVFHREVTLSGNHTVDAGAFVSKVQTGDAFGTGSIALTGTGALEFRPSDAVPTAVSLTVASRADTLTADGARVVFAGGNHLVLDRGANPSLTVTLGGNNGDGVANLVAAHPGATLVIEANDLGGSERLLVTGTGDNLPALTNGMVGGNIVGASGSAATGAFLTYDAADGFLAAVTMQGNINTATSTTIYEAATSQTLTGNSSVFALAVGNVTIDGASVLSVGAGAGPAGMILNGGTVATRGLAFGGAQAAVYTSRDGGTINAPLTGTGGFSKFGPGTLAVSGNASALTGAASVQSGTLALNAAWGASSTTVLANAVLEVNTGGSVTGNVTASADATVTLNGGTVQNLAIQSTTNASGPIQGGTLQGTGTVAGTLLLNGYIAADPVTQVGTLTIEGLVTAGAGAAFIWSLPTLVDNTTGVAGTNWNAVNLTNADATFGDIGGNDVSVFFDFASGLDPNSGNAFWLVDHEWTLLTFSGRASADRRANLSFPSSAFPAGNFRYEHQGNEIVLTFTAVPEPSVAGLLAVSAAFAWFLRRKSRRRCSG